MNVATIRNFGESKGLDLGTDALAAEVKGVGYVIYVDKEDYSKATKIFENTYNTNVVVKLKEDMSDNQKIEYNMAKGGVDFSGIDKFLAYSIYLVYKQPMHVNQTVRERLI